MRTFRATLITLLLLAFSLFYPSTERQALSQPAPAGSVNMALGNPSNATTEETDTNNLLVVRPEFALSYNRSRGGPNWVSWHVQRSDFGNFKRKDNFAPDPLLPAPSRIRPGDYKDSGFDRGHQCPSGDRTASRKANDTTFVMSNMLPQRPGLNRNPWENLESYCRTLVRQGSELYIIAGGQGTKQTIAGGKLNVPTDCWKVIVVLPEGSNDLSRINNNTRVIAVSMPNKSEIAGDRWTKFITTIAAVETATGYHFLSEVPEPVRAALATKRDTGRAPARPGRNR